MREPIIGAQALARGVLIVGEQGPAVAILATPEPAERTLRIVDEDGPAHALDLPLRDRAKLMLLPEGVAVALPLTRCLASHR